MSNELSPIEKAAAELGEHYDPVMIVCTRHEAVTEGGSTLEAHGTGNYYGRIGSVRQWLVKQEEEARVRARPTN